MAPPGAPADANAAAGDTAQRADPPTTGTVALGHTECDVVRGIGAPGSVNLSNNARGDRVAVSQLLPRPARRNLYIHRRTSDLGRTRAGAGAAAEGR